MCVCVTVWNCEWICYGKCIANDEGLGISSEKISLFDETDLLVRLDQSARNGFKHAFQSFWDK